MSGKEISNREKVLQFYIKNPLASHSTIAKELNIGSSNVGYIIRHLRQSKTIEKKISSWKIEKISKKIESKKHQSFNFQESNAVLERFCQIVQT